MFNFEIGVTQMSSWKVLERDKVELAFLNVKEVWKRKFTGQFYLVKEGDEVLVVNEEQVKLHGRTYLVNVKSKLDVSSGNLVRTRGPQDIPLYIRREDSLWIVERLSRGQLLWSRKFQESEISATHVGNLVFITGIDKNRSCAYMFSSSNGKLLWSLERDYNTDFFVTSIKTSPPISVVSVTWFRGLNNVTISQGGRLVFLEVVSDPFYGVVNDEKAVKDELYAIDSLDGSILWREVHDLIETKETPRGIIVEALNSQGEAEKCTIKFISSDGTITWLREYNGYVKVFNASNMIALESDNSIEVINLISGKRTLLLSNSKRVGTTLGKLLKDKVVVEEYRPTRGRHSLKAFNFKGELLWEVYLSPESSTIVDLSDDNFGAIHVRGYVYLINLNNGRVIKAARTGKVVALFLRYPFIVTVREGPPNTRVYDALSGTVIFEFDEVLRSEDVLPINDYVLIQFENSLHSYTVRRSYVICSYPRSIMCKRGTLLRIEYDFTRVDKPVELVLKRIPFIKDVKRRIEVRDSRNVILKLRVPSSVPPGLYEVMTSVEAKGASRRLVTQLIVD